MNVVMSKAGAGVILRCLLGWEVDVDALPWGEELDGEAFGAGELAGGLETVIKAGDVPWKNGCRPDNGPGDRVDVDSGKMS
jgi:DEAD/DEAH box helicase domain-containing protein